MHFLRNAPALPLPLLALLALIPATGCGHGSTGATGTAGADWKADAALAAKLGPEVVVDGYALRPPAGWTEQVIPVTAQTRAWVARVWVSPAHADGIQSRLWMQVGTGSEAEARQIAPVGVVGMGLGRVARDHVNLTLAPFQSGTLGGTPGARCYWKGRGLKTGKTFHGMIYGSVSGPNAVELEARDSEPYHKSTLPLCEAAILTVRKV